MTMTVGRNDPCSCGSGRKFKHCCLRAVDAEESLRVRLRSAEGVLVPALFAYALQECGDDYFDEAWQEFFLWEAVPETVDNSKEFGTTFDPFFVFSFVPDSSEDDLPDSWPTEPLALHFLHHEADAAPELHREFIEQACRSPASFFVVEQVTPGRSLDLKDILTGRRFHVLEQSASRTLKPGQIAYTRVVTAGGGSIMIGACPWIIPASWHIPIIEFRERLGPRRLLTRDEVLDYDVEIREFYHEIVDALLHPAPPVLKNTDGDPFELITLTYKLGITAAEAVERLAPLATLRGEVYFDDEAHDTGGALVAATLTWIKAGNRTHKDWDNTTLGTLRVDGTRLVVEVNSAKRRRRIEKEIRTRLGSSATLTDTTVTDPIEALAERRLAGPAPPPPPQAPELAAIEAELARRHWDAWLDTKVPALGNKTPKEAARSRGGRERLEALLADFAHASADASRASDPDVAALRRMLGLD